MRPPCLLPDEILDASPSERDGVAKTVEARHRRYGCYCIAWVCRSLRLPMRVRASGQLLLQRFFYRKSLVRFDALSVAMGTLLLAMKMEEHLGDSEDAARALLVAFERLCQRLRAGDPIPMQKLGETARRWRAVLYEMESHVLKELGFVFGHALDHPHDYVRGIARHLQLPRPVLERACSIAGESLLCDVGLRYGPGCVAAACVYIAGRQLRVPLPEEPAPWWALLDCSSTELAGAASALLDLREAMDGDARGFTWIEPLAAERSFFAAPPPAGAVAPVNP